MFQNPYASLMGQNQYYNMQQQNQNFQNQFQQSNPQNLIRVSGMDGAKAYQMPANSTVALFANNEDVMYIKSTDGAGFPSIRVFDFVERTQTEPETKVVELNNNFISRQEFEEFKREVLSNGKQSIQRSKSLKPDKSADD